jgi:hypothetical protein
MVDERDDAFLGTAVATGRDRRQAFVVMGVLVAAFAVTAPLAQRRVPAIPQFVPIYDTASTRWRPCSSTRSSSSFPGAAC